MENRSIGHIEASASVSDKALIHTAASYAPAFLEAFPFPLAAVDLDLRLIGFNNAFRMKFATLCSCEPRLHDEVQTLPFVVDRGPLAGETFSALCRRALKAGAFQISGHYAGTTASQKARLGFTPVYDPSGTPLMLTISMQDWVIRSEARSQDVEPDEHVQARRRAEKALTAATNEFQATFDLAPIGMAHIALNGQWLRGNHHLCDMLGYSLNELLLLRFHDLTHPADLDPETVRIQQLLDGIISSYTLEKRYLHKEGHIIWVRLVVSLVREEAGKPKYFIAVLNNISAEKQATLQLEKSRARIRAVFDNLSEAVFVFDAAGQVIEANPSAIGMFGYADLNEARTRLNDIEKIFAVHSLDAKVLPVKDWPVSKVLRGETVVNVELEMVRLDSGHQWIASFSGKRIVNARGIPQLAVLTARDVTKRYYAEIALRVSEQRFRTAFDNIPDMVVIYNRELCIEYVNLTMVRITGRAASEFVQRRDEEFLPRGLPAPWRPLLLRAVETASVQTSELEYPSSRGLRNVVATCVPLLNAPGLVQEVMAIFHDDTERRQAEEKIRKAALHDPLTGLPNRALLFEYARHIFATAQRANQQVAVLFIDLDRFKPINDLHGHETGDEVLSEVARRLGKNVREEDIVFRMGGDEFLILVPRINDPHIAGEVALHLMDLLNSPYPVGNLELTLSASIGISLYPRDGHHIDELINHADAAMYCAKQLGRNGYQFYTSGMAAQSESQSVIEQQLKKALAREEFCLAYQPVVDMHTNTLVCVEALLRWPGNSATPDRFVPIAEATGLIRQVSEWVLDEACRQHKLWLEKGLPGIPIAVNISSVQFRRKELVQHIKDTLCNHALDPVAIQLELTETAVMDDIDHAIAVLEQFKQMGIKIALDDFGTGYSSLNYLSRLPLDKIKVDKSFVQRIETDMASCAITEAIIALGKTLNLKIVAEGIESAEIFDYLLRHGCNQAQGFHICPPLDGDNLAIWYKKHIEANGG